MPANPSEIPLLEAVASVGTTKLNAAAEMRGGKGGGVKQEDEKERVKWGDRCYYGAS